MAPSSTQDLRTPLGTRDTNRYRSSVPSLAFDKSPTAFPSLSPVTPARSYFAHPKPPNVIQLIDDPILSIDSPADAAACLDMLEKNLDARSSFQQRPMTTFREQDFSNGPAMAQAIGRHLPQAMTDLIEIMNKIDWLNSCLRSSLAVARCYQKAFVSVMEDMEELKVQMSALERANNIQGIEEDRMRKRRKTSAWPKNRELEVSPDCWL